MFYTIPRSNFNAKCIHREIIENVKIRTKIVDDPYIQIDWMGGIMTN